MEVVVKSPIPQLSTRLQTTKENGKIITNSLANDLRLEVLKRTGRCWWSINGRSMLPLFNRRAQVLVTTIQPERVRIGDVIVFKRNDTLVTHRVIKKKNSPDGLVFVEKGDGTHEHSTVNGRDVIGTVLMVRRNGRLYFLQSPLSRHINLVLALFLRVTSLGVTWLHYSNARLLNRAGRIASPLMMVASNIMIRLCFPFWAVSRRSSCHTYRLVSQNALANCEAAGEVK